jgi:hypothetical protein
MVISRKVLREGHIEHTRKKVGKLLLRFGRTARKKRFTGQIRHRWGDNIKIDSREMRWDLWTRFTSFRVRTSGRLMLMR